MSGAVTRLMPARGTVLMPVAKLSPISQATISITPWMPKVNMSDSTGSPVKFVMPSQVVQPPASDSTSAALPSSASCQLVKKMSSTTRQKRGPSPVERGDDATISERLRRRRIALPTAGLDIARVDDLLHIHVSELSHPNPGARQQLPSPGCPASLRCGTDATQRCRMITRPGHFAAGMRRSHAVEAMFDAGLAVARSIQELVIG